HLRKLPGLVTQLTKELRQRQEEEATAHGINPAAETDVDEPDVNEADVNEPDVNEAEETRKSEETGTDLQETRTAPGEQTELTADEAAHGTLKEHYEGLVVQARDSSAIEYVHGQYTETFDGAPHIHPVHIIRYRKPTPENLETSLRGHIEETFTGTFHTEGTSKEDPQGETTGLPEHTIIENLQGEITKELTEDTEDDAIDALSNPIPNLEEETREVPHIIPALLHDIPDPPAHDTDTPEETPAAPAAPITLHSLLTGASKEATTGEITEQQTGDGLRLTEKTHGEYQTDDGRQRPVHSNRTGKITIATQSPADEDLQPAQEGTSPDGVPIRKRIKLVGSEDRGVSYEVHMGWDYVLQANDSGWPGRSVIFRRAIGGGYKIEFDMEASHRFWAIDSDSAIYLNTNRNAAVFQIEQAAAGEILLQRKGAGDHGYVRRSTFHEKRWLYTLEDRDHAERFRVSENANEITGKHTSAGIYVPVVGNDQAEVEIRHGDYGVKVKMPESPVSETWLVRISYLDHQTKTNRPSSGFAPLGYHPDRTLRSVIGYVGSGKEVTIPLVNVSDLDEKNFPPGSQVELSPSRVRTGMNELKMDIQLAQSEFNARPEYAMTKVIDEVRAKISSPSEGVSAADLEELNKDYGQEAQKMALYLGKKKKVFGEFAPGAAQSYAQVYLITAHDIKPDLSGELGTWVKKPKIEARAGTGRAIPLNSPPTSYLFLPQLSEFKADDTGVRIKCPPPISEGGERLPMLILFRHSTLIDIIPMDSKWHEVDRIIRDAAKDGESVIGAILTKSSNIASLPAQTARFLPVHDATALPEEGADEFTLPNGYPGSAELEAMEIQRGYEPFDWRGIARSIDPALGLLREIGISEHSEQLGKSILNDIAELGSSSTGGETAAEDSTSRAPAGSEQTPPPSRTGSTENLRPGTPPPSRTGSTENLRPGTPPPSRTGSLAGSARAHAEAMKTISEYANASLRMAPFHRQVYPEKWSAQAVFPTPEEIIRDLSGVHDGVARDPWIVTRREEWEKVYAIVSRAKKKYEALGPDAGTGSAPDLTPGVPAGPRTGSVPDLTPGVPAGPRTGSVPDLTPGVPAGPRTGSV
ncbi:hypothetical protein ABZ667_42675, partial [Streptomyces lavendulae]